MTKASLSAFQLSTAIFSTALERDSTTSLTIRNAAPAPRLAAFASPSVFWIHSVELARPYDASAATSDLPAAILIVDDNATNRKIMRRQVRSLGFPVDEASNGLEALACLSRRPYKLVLMDCQMPHLDGYSATRCLRVQEGCGPRTAVVAVTANSAPGNRERCFAAGMDDYLVKPVNAQVLDNTLRRWLVAS